MNAARFATFARLGCFASSLFATRIAGAQEQAPEPRPKVVTPLPGQAAAAAPAEERITVTATCSLGEHLGVDELDARTAADVVCHELAARRATNTEHEVRFGRLGRRIIVTLASRNGNSYDERRTFVRELDEIYVAAPRLAEALVEGKELDETRTVENVLESEATPPKLRGGVVRFDAGFFGQTTVGALSAVAAGVDVGLGYRTGPWNFGFDLRLGGIGSDRDKPVAHSFDLTSRYYFTVGDSSPYVGAGMGIASTKLRHSGGTFEGAGIGMHAIVGFEFLRTQHLAPNIFLRADVPLYTVDGDWYGRGQETWRYVIPVSLNASIAFK
ncbi:hypothetical protein AKJ09_04265 [Labilithrix luteola]|uniref:Outer membrane protein beta-barrel domain-containing protein n=1 Tax=Labilithrix luteola TaxID=1391654 RepID=A0A0K1PW24_9BACT|nr:outer membrane beta-barrel protein [Labilithrix luteola]AKU97601.1 hypothetical protein AKJ09_04265 [Labilithrix luteola]